MTGRSAPRFAGTAIGVTVIGLWLVHGVSLLEGGIPKAAPVAEVVVLAARVVFQGYLTTGLFMTAHDAMHGTVSPSRRVNDAIGALASFLFAGMSYGRLVVNHGRHHGAPGTDDDPDYCATRGFFGFFVWFGTFIRRYATIPQFVVMALLFNLLKIRYEEPAIWLFWVVPAVFASFQMFFFGTYLPHRLPHTADMQPDNARTLRKNHVVAMLTCYFFGYHAEHHASPSTPWWGLAALKSRLTARS